METGPTQPPTTAYDELIEYAPEADPGTIDIGALLTALSPTARMEVSNYLLGVRVENLAAYAVGLRQNGYRHHDLVAGHLNPPPATGPTTKVVFPPEGSRIDK